MNQTQKIPLSITHPHLYEVLGTFVFALGFTVIVATPGLLTGIILLALRVKESTATIAFLAINLVSFFIVIRQDYWRVCHGKCHAAKRFERMSLCLIKWRDIFFLFRGAHNSSIWHSFLRLAHYMWQKRGRLRLCMSQLSDNRLFRT